MIAGRPLWFVLIVIGGWTTLRMVSILAVADGPSGGPAQRAAAGPVRRGQPALPESIIRVAQAPTFAPWHAGLRKPGRSQAAAEARDPSHARPAPAEASEPPVILSARVPDGGFFAQEAGIPGPSIGGAQAGRWSGAAWLLWRRDGGEVPLARAGRLGGSQVGLRVDYALDRGSPLHPALYARLSGALARPVAAEIAAGIALRPTPLPLSFALERRAALSRGGRNDFAFIVAGGIDRLPLTPHLHIDGYGQAGFVGLARPDAFVDGRLTLERAVSGTETGNGDIAIGAALWGGAQPGIARLDIGPQATVRMPVGASHVRLATEWRQRISGHARPASGPSITIGLDF